MWPWIPVVWSLVSMFFFFFQAEDGIRDIGVTGVQTCALPISADQGLLRHQRERGEDANLDRGVDLCAGGDRAEAVGAGSQSLPDSTDSQRYPFRENAHFTGTSEQQLPI